MGIFKIDTLNDYHLVCRGKEKVDEAILFFYNLSVSDERSLPRVRAHLHNLEGVSASFQECLDAYLEGVRQRTARELRYKSEKGIKREGGRVGNTENKPLEEK